jgi:2-iminobutanoate/2-iminopropanoate deaminase
VHPLPALGQGDEGRVKQLITSPDAPAAGGAYSPALRVGQLLFLSGQIPIDPATGQLVTGDAPVHARRVMENLGVLLKAAGLSFASVVRTTIFLADMNDFAVVNDVYASYFSDPKPARVTVQAARLPRDARIEIDAIASYDA